MEIGNKIFELRKKNSLSQEELAERIGVSRQTISKWELGETSPDLKQAKELSKVFKISLDELVNNDIKDLLVEKTSNTERLAGIIIKLLKIIGIVFLTLFIIDLIVFIIFFILGFKAEKIMTYENADTITCLLNKEEYNYGKYVNSR